MAKAIITIGFRLAGGGATEEDFQSRASLLDWDIILFKTTLGPFRLSSDSFEGKPCLSDARSFQIKEICEHWRREIKQAFDTGKTVIVFLSEIEAIYIANGEKSYSGTGRNRETTRIVVPHDSYSTLPLKLKPVNAAGKAMKLTAKGSQILGSFWSEFSGVCEYKTLLPDISADVCIVTKSGDRPVGALFKNPSSSGSILLLPNIDFMPDDFTEEKGGDTFWSAKANQFAAKFLKSVVALDGTLRSVTEFTPAPSWTEDRKYALEIEQSLQSELLKAEKAVETANKHKEDIFSQLQSSRKLRELLYEKGKPLEDAIIAALELLGFRTSQYKDGNSEFDVLFESSEGRLLGEAEGKDTKAVNIDKMRQLSMNIYEDLQREEVKEPAKGVLFGNGYRLKSPNERDVQFTEKCVTAAKSSATALVATSDLFTVAQYMTHKADESFAKLCRAAILNSSGIVTFPSPPTASEKEVEAVEEQSS